jgi:mono/diheme cytochrome c family protein
MRTVLVTVAALAGAAVLGGAAFIYSGAYDVAATAPHWPLTHRILEAARVRSIKAHAAGIVPPGDLGDRARVVAGTSHFAEHCAMCHAAPGVEAQDLAEGLYPKPPVLTDVARRYTPGELFWILKNGIKASGMPSWGDHGDEDLWNTVAFMERLPGMSEQDYGKLVMAAMAAGGHHMHGRGSGGGPMNMDGMDMGGAMDHGGGPGQPGPQGR